MHHFVITAPELLSYSSFDRWKHTLDREKECATIFATAEEFGRIWVKRSTAYFHVIDTNRPHKNVLLIVERVSIPSAKLCAVYISIDPSTITTAMRLEHFEREISMIYT